MNGAPLATTSSCPRRPQWRPQNSPPQRNPVGMLTLPRNLRPGTLTLTAGLAGEAVDPRGLPEGVLPLCQTGHKAARGGRAGGACPPRQWTQIQADGTCRECDEPTFSPNG